MLHVLATAIRSNKNLWKTLFIFWIVVFSVCFEMPDLETCSAPWHAMQCSIICHTLCTHKHWKCHTNGCVVVGTCTIATYKGADATMYSSRYHFITLDPDLNFAANDFYLSTWLRLPLCMWRSCMYPPQHIHHWCGTFSAHEQRHPIPFSL